MKKTITILKNINLILRATVLAIIMQVTYVLLWKLSGQYPLFDPFGFMTYLTMFGLSASIVGYYHYENKINNYVR